MIEPVTLWQVVIELRGACDRSRCTALAGALPEGMHGTVRATAEATEIEVHVYAQRWVTAQEIAARAARQALREVGIDRLDVRRVEVVEGHRIS